VKFDIRFLLLLFAFSLPAQAHELKIDGNVGGLLHLEPDDTAKVGLPETAIFRVVKRGGEPLFLEQCTCILTVYQGDRKLSQTRLVPSTIPAASMGWTAGFPSAQVKFPSEGSYSLVLSGTPASGGFPPFTLRWEVQATN